MIEIFGATAILLGGAYLYSRIKSGFRDLPKTNYGYDNDGHDNDYCDRTAQWRLRTLEVAYHGNIGKFKAIEARLAALETAKDGQDAWLCNLDERVQEIDKTLKTMQESHKNLGKQVHVLKNKGVWA